MQNLKYKITCEDETCQYRWKSEDYDQICPRCGSIELNIEPAKEDKSPFYDAT